MKALVGAFNQKKALVGAFSVIVQLHRLIDLRHYFIPSSNDQPIKSAIVDTKNLKLFRSATDRWNKTDFVPISFSPRRDICVSCLLIIILTRHYQSLFGPSQLVATIFIKRMINLAAAATWVIHPAGGRPRQQQNAELFSERGEPLELETKVHEDFTHNHGKGLYYGFLLGESAY